MKDLKVFIDDDGSFTDISEDMKTYLRDSVVAPLVATEDYLYFGLYKPFQSVYVELSVVNTASTELTVEYWNGTAWTAVSNLEELTKGLTRSAFISWDLALTNWAESAVNSETQYWVRISPSVSLDLTTAIQGLNIVFANDLDLQEAYYSVPDLLPQDASSFISFHQAARNEIIQNLRNSGNYTTGGDLSKWDLLQPYQIREAAKWKALEILFFECSNEVEDKYDMLAKSAARKYKAAINLYLKSIDKNDDGVLSDTEKFSISTTMVTRI